MERLPFWVNTIDALGRGSGVPARPAPFDGSPPSFTTTPGRVTEGISSSFAPVHPFLSTTTLRLRDLFAYRSSPQIVSSPAGGNAFHERGEEDEGGGPRKVAEVLPASCRRKQTGRVPSTTYGVEKRETTKDKDEGSDSEDDGWEEILLANYRMDLPWLLQEVPEIMMVKRKLVILSGEKGTATYRREKRFAPSSPSSTTSSSSPAGVSSSCDPRLERRGRKSEEKRSSDGVRWCAAEAGIQPTSTPEWKRHRTDTNENDDATHHRNDAEKKEEEWWYVPVPIAVHQKNPFIAAVRDASRQWEALDTAMHHAERNGASRPSSSSSCSLLPAPCGGSRSEGKDVPRHHRTAVPSPISFSFSPSASLHRTPSPCLPSAVEQKMVVIEPFLPLPYGTHHAKMALLVNRRGLRVAIFTANFLFSDWHAKTQGIYTQDFPRCAPCGTTPTTTTTTTTASASLLVEPSPGQDFKDQLQRYLNGCGVRYSPNPTTTSSSSSSLFGTFGERSFLDGFDFSAVRVRLVTSVPGVYCGSRMISLFGMGRVAALLAYYHASPPLVHQEETTEAGKGPDFLPPSSPSSASVFSSFSDEQEGRLSGVQKECTAATRPPLPHASVFSWQYSSQGSVDHRFLHSFQLAMQGRAPYFSVPGNGTVLTAERATAALAQGKRAAKRIRRGTVSPKRSADEEEEEERKEMPRVQVIYPTEREVRCSLEGWRGGLSLPLSLRCCHPFINARLHRWTGRAHDVDATHRERRVAERRGGNDEVRSDGGEGEEGRCRPCHGTAEGPPPVPGAVAPFSSRSTSAIPPAHPRRLVHVVESESEAEEEEEEEEEAIVMTRQTTREKRQKERPFPTHERENDTTIGEPHHTASPIVSSYATALPHIKSYAGVVYPSHDASPASRYLSWFMLTSANLSKAAWGSLTPIQRKRSHTKRTRRDTTKKVPQSASSLFPPPASFLSSCRETEAVGEEEVRPDRGHLPTATAMPSTPHALHHTPERAEKKMRGPESGGGSGLVEDRRHDKGESEGEVAEAEEEEGWKLTIWSYECGVLYLPSIYFSSPPPFPRKVSTSPANLDREQSPFPSQGGCAFTCTPAFTPFSFPTPPSAPSSFSPSDVPAAHDASPFSLSSCPSSPLLYPTRCGITGKEATMIYVPYDILHPTPYASTPYLYHAEIAQRISGPTAPLEVVSSGPEKETNAPESRNGRGGECQVKEESPTNRRKTPHGSSLRSQHGEAHASPVDPLIPSDDIPWVLEVPHRGVDSHGLQIHEMVSNGVEQYGPSSWGVRLCRDGGVLQGLWDTPA